MLFIIFPEPTYAPHMIYIPPVYVVKAVTLLVSIDDLTHPIDERCPQSQDGDIAIFHLFAKSAQVRNLSF